ncbi:hypothetical protein HB774_25330 (plasmid) [Rhizobium leguminosarum bv. viciae]|nr:hypothetical protein HB774_25330 [Rhizobium leguminosarum bv. viciae]
MLGVELVNPDMSKSVILATRSKTLPTPPALDQPAGATHSPMRSTLSRCRSAFGLDPTGLAERTSISAVSIRAFEKGGHMRESNLRLLTLTFEAAGIIFQADGEVTGGGIGVRLRSSIDDA